MKIYELFETNAGRGAPLYHATNLENIKRILQNNMLQASTGHEMQYFKPELRGTKEARKRIMGVSLTRDKNFAEEWADVILVLDQNKIRHNNKLVPINYFHDDGTQYIAQDREEREEFVVGPIKNLDRCLIGIYFPKRVEHEYLDWKWVQKNIKPVPEEFGGWKAVLESPKYIGKPLINSSKKKAIGEAKQMQTPYVFNKNMPIIWQAGDMSIRLDNLQNPKRIFLADKEKCVGYLITTDWAEFTKSKYKQKYLSVESAEILPKYRGKGYGKLLYKLLLQHLNKKYLGIESDLEHRYNKKRIAKIYKSLGGYEKDGFAFIDKKKINENIEYRRYSNLDVVKNKDLTQKLLNLSNQSLEGGIKAILNYPEENKSIVTVAYDHDQPIGWATFTPGGEYSLDTVNVYVDKDHRKKGIGTKLQKLLINESDNLLEGAIYLVPLTPRYFRLDKKAVKNTLLDLIHGKFSQTKDPIEVEAMGHGQLQVVDGYHRLVQAILLGKRKIKVVQARKDPQTEQSFIPDINLWNWNINASLDKNEIYDLVAKLRKNNEENGILKEQGRIVQGVNTPVGITIDHTKKMAARLGFNVSRDGRPPVMPTNGMINNTPPVDPDHSKEDKKSMFTGPDLTKWTDYKGKDIAD